jgi:hypothetical protein
MKLPKAVVFPSKTSAARTRSANRRAHVESTNRIVEILHERKFGRRASPGQPEQTGFASPGETRCVEVAAKKQKTKMTATEYAQLLVEQGFYQTSRKYADLARLPLGKSGRKALFDARMAELGELTPELLAFWKKDTLRWVTCLGEESSASQYVRVYASANERRTVSQTVLREFRRLGGKVA